jgi:hypothetical protein
MKTTLSTSEAADILFNDKNANWSYAGARALVEYLEEYEESTGEELEFDYVAIRCDFSEHDSLVEWANDYFAHDNWRDNVKCDYEADESELDEKIREYIQDHGQLIEFEGGIIVSSF